MVLSRIRLPLCYDGISLYFFLLQIIHFFVILLKSLFLIIVFFFLSFVFCLFRAARMAYGGSHARIRAVAAGLCHSHSNAGSETHLQPTP